MRENEMFRSIDFAAVDHSKDQYNFKEFYRNFSNFHRDNDQEGGTVFLNDTLKMVYHSTNICQCNNSKTGR